MMAIRHGLFGVLVATIAIDLVIAVGIFDLAIPLDHWHGLLAVLALLWLIIVVQGWSLSRNKELASRLSRERGQLQSILDALPVLVSYADSRERFQFNNLAFEKWFGQHPSAIKGMMVCDLFGEAAYPALGDSIRLALGGQETAFHEVSYHDQSHDQGQRWLQVTMIPDKEVGGIVPGFVAMMRDVTAQKQLGQQYRQCLEEDVQERTAALHEEALLHAADLKREIAVHTRELREANIRLQELDRLKSKFVSDVSHELRTPMTNMNLYLKLLRRKPEKQAQYLQILEEEANRLETLVLDVLDLARLDDKPEVTLSPVDLNELLATVVMAQQATAEKRNLRLSFHPNPKVPRVWGDANKLMQIATNLVINALNYTPSGYVQLCTYAGEPHHISFDVADSGTGIYPEDMPHLYERFYRGRRDRVSDVPGSGLGLSIVKELIELQGGSIYVDSKVGVGTTFTITLPAATPAETSTVTSTETPAETVQGNSVKLAEN
jgi:PAS domain S-box-containing protein